MNPLEQPLKRTSIQRKWVKCGKKGCDKCPHGPYLYRQWRDGDRVRTEYLGPMKAPKLPEGAALAGPAVAATGSGTVPRARPKAKEGIPRRKHPMKVGDSVRFSADKQPVWIILKGKRQFAREDAPPMRVDKVGWGVFGGERRIYPYALLVLEDGRPVYHPYDATMAFADPQRRLDRRFPAPLLEKVVVNRPRRRKKG